MSAVVFRIKKMLQLSKNQNKFSYLIIGGGSVGTAVAHFLLNNLGISSKDIFLCKREGPSFFQHRFETNHKTYQIETESPSPDKLQKINLCFVCVKAFDLKQALLQHLSAINPKACVVILCNGFLNEELNPVISTFSSFKWRQGVATLGISKAGDQCYALKSLSGQITWGPLMPEKGRPLTSELFLLKQDVFGVFSWRNNIKPLVMKKWLFNTVINTLSVVKNTSNNKLLLDYQSELESLFVEGFHLAEKIFGEPWSETYDGLFEDMVLLIENTGGNENSMHRDVIEKRKTESSYLAGLALRYDNEFPLLCSLHQSIISNS